jgi:MFS transporter, DHA3 family, multidrug efflux protein
MARCACVVQQLAWRCVHVADGRIRSRTGSSVGASIVVVTLGSLIWLTTMPVIEAAEQSVLQRAVPFERQGRVFGFAQAVESASSPMMALAIGPFASGVAIPFMTGRGGDLFGSFLGRGVVGGLGLCFGTAGVIGLLVAVSGRFSNPYRRLDKSLQVKQSVEASTAVPAG